MNKHKKAFSTACSIEEGERAVTAKISTATMDRDGEVLMPMGCNTKDYEKNPVVFLGHNYYTLPIGKCVALKRTESEIIAKTIFAERPEDHPEGQEWAPDTVLSLFKQGVLSAFSIGAEYIEHRDATKDDRKKYGDGCRRVVSKWKLMEYSVVPLPANQDAVAMAVSKGIVSEATAKELFGVVTSVGYDSATRNLTVTKEIVPEPRPSVQVKRITYYVGFPGIAPAGDIVKRFVLDVSAAATKAEIQKRRGRLYYVP